MTAEAAAESAESHQTRRYPTPLDDTSRHEAPALTCKNTDDAR
jgi:hypothetical protein